MAGTWTGTVRVDDLVFVSQAQARTRLGLLVLLKFFEVHAHFPDNDDGFQLAQRSSLQPRQGSTSPRSTGTRGRVTRRAASSARAGLAMITVDPLENWERCPRPKDLPVDMGDLAPNERESPVAAASSSSNMTSDGNGARTTNPPAANPPAGSIACSWEPSRRFSSPLPRTDHHQRPSWPSGQEFSDQSADAYRRAFPTS